MKKILIITWDMIPYTKVWGNSQRILFLADYLSKRGNKVNIVCAYNGQFKNEVDIEKMPFNIYSYNYHGIQITKRNSENVKETERKSGFIKYIIGDLCAHILNLFFNENNYRNSLKVFLWSISNKRNIQYILSQEKYDDVIISAPPHTIFMLSQFIKNQNTKIILDYRDPWNLWRKNFPASKFIENRLLNIASHIVFTNKNVMYDTAREYGMNLSKFSVVANGYSQTSWEEFRKKRNLKKSHDKKFVVSYVGGIGINNRVSYRDCTYLIEAFVKLWKKEKNCILKMIGVTDINRNNYMEYSKMGIEIRGQVSEEDSYLEMISADVLIVLHTAVDGSGKYIISAKLYDYIASGTYILAIGNEGDLHQTIVEKEGVGEFVINDINAIYTSLEKLYREWDNRTLKRCGNKMDYAEYSRERQYQKYEQLL